MRTKYKYINFVESDMFLSHNTVWLCKNNRSGVTLAKIYWEKQWNQHVAVFNKDAIFSNDCLVDIADFMGQINKGETDEYKV